MIIAAMKTLKNLRFFSRRTDPENAWQRIAWWEIRRVPYNLVVGVSGTVSLVLIFISAAMAERTTGVPMGIPDPPIFAFAGVLLYAVLANVCFTAGWIVEILVVKIWGDQGRQFGAISFTLGMIFSVLLTISIGLFFAALNIIQILLYASGRPIIQ